MCDCNPDCQCPENLKGKPEDCTPEQIEICHREMQNRSGGSSVQGDD